MAAINLIGEYRREPVNSGILSRLGAELAGIIQRHVERRAVVRLSRLEPRLIRDMGFDPAAVYGAVEGTWDEVVCERDGGLDD